MLRPSFASIDHSPLLVSLLLTCTSLMTFAVRDNTSSQNYSFVLPFRIVSSSLSNTSFTHHITVVNTAPEMKGKDRYPHGKTSDNPGPYNMRPRKPVPSLPKVKRTENLEEGEIDESIEAFITDCNKKLDDESMFNDLSAEMRTFIDTCNRPYHTIQPLSMVVQTSSSTR